jgi:beta-galactosidase/beta-glucuronidase
MPTMVHDVLIDHRRIETPWLPGAAAACQWVAESDWVYGTRFRAEDPMARSYLRFEGLDTITDVYLNGRKIASHCNMYEPLRVEVSGKLGPVNTLTLHFHSVFEMRDGRRTRVGRIGPEPSQRVRRSHQNYGNYLGPQPSFSRVGVYAPVYLETLGDIEITEVMTGASLDESLTRGAVTVDVAGHAIRSTDATIRVLVSDAIDGATVAETTQRKPLSEGGFSTRVTLPVDRPKLWWPRGYGDQSLYRVRVQVEDTDTILDHASRTIGFRRVTMPQRLHFEINGVPVRLWGGDWVTPRWQTAVWDPRRAEMLLQMAENANFNAFRVWGVIESPPNAFYEMAAERGFLIWQDFTDLPLAPDVESRAICRREATATIKRLKHYPSIIAWCGCNESAMWNHEAFNGRLEHRGPWRGLPAAEEVGEICGKLDPERYYQPSSPYYGIDPNDPQEGNTHGYTNMWWVPGYDYLNFASEDTRIAAPQLHSLKRFMEPQHIWPPDYSPVYTHGDVYPYPKTWLRYTTGSSWKKTGPVELFYDANDPASLVYRLGMAEALYYQDVIERQRRGRDATDATDRRRCGGYLVWKFNDSWPHIYSGKVDYFLEPYHVYYALRHAFAPVMLSFDKGAYIYLWAVNDSPRAVSGRVRIQLFHPDRNEVRKEIVRDAEVAPGKSRVVVRLDEAGIGTFRREHILHAALVDDSGRQIADAFSYGDIERRMRFPDAKLDVTVVDGVLKIRSDRFARAVTLTGDADGDCFGWFFEDNYFDLMPGETKAVRILGEHAEGRVSAKAWYSPHVTTVEWSR